MYLHGKLLTYFINVKEFYIAGYQRVNVLETLLFYLWNIKL